MSSFPRSPGVDRRVVVSPSIPVGASVLLHDSSVELWDPRPSTRPATNTARVAVVVYENPPLIKVFSSDLKETLFTLSPPFRIVPILATSLFPNQIRLFKERDTEHGSLTVGVILFPSLPLDQWTRVVRSASSHFPATPRDPCVFRVVCPGAAPDHQVCTVSVSDCPTVNDVLDAVVHRRLGLVPTTHLLAYAPSTPLTAEWFVTDSEPASLRSFVGETLYAVPRGRDPPDQSVALESWLSESLRIEPNAVSVLRRWPSVGDSQRAIWKRNVARSFLKLAPALIELAYSAASVPLQISVDPARLHEPGASIPVAEGETVERQVFVTNCDSESAKVTVDLPDSLAGLSVSCTPSAQIIPPGEKRGFRFQFTLATHRVRKEDPVLCIAITSSKAKSLPRPGQKPEVPFFMPFTFTIPEPAPAVVSDEISPSALPAALAPVSIVDTSIVYRVEWERRPMLMKSIKFSPAVKEAVRSQMSFLASSIRHEGVVRVEKYAIDDEHGILTVILPDVTTRGRISTLRNFLLSDDGARLTWEQVIKLVRDICSALDFVQRSGGTYGRLSPESVAVLSDATSVRALLLEVGRVDGSCITQVSPQQPDFVLVTAPEVLAREQFIAECASSDVPPAAAVRTPRPRSGDTFDFSLLLYMLICRVAPFSDSRTQWKDKSALEMRVLNQEFRPNLALVPPDCPAGLRSLMVQMWEGSSTRLTPSDILDSLRIVDVNETVRPCQPVKSKSREASPEDAGHPKSGQRLTLKDALESGKQQQQQQGQDSSSGNPSPLATSVSVIQEESSIPKSVSIDSLWELLILPDKQDGGRELRTTAAAASASVMPGTSAPLRGTSPLVQMVHSMSSTAIAAIAASAQSGVSTSASVTRPRRGSDGAVEPPEADLGGATLQSVKFRVMLPDGSKNSVVLSPTDTLSKLLRKVGYAGHELIYSHTKEVFTEKLLQRARRVQSSHAVVVNVVPQSEMREVRVTVSGGNLRLGWERQEHVDGIRIHVNATCADILKAVNRRKREFNQKENVILCNGRALPSDAQPLRKSGLNFAMARLALNPPSPSPTGSKESSPSPSSSFGTPVIAPLVMPVPAAASGSSSPTARVEQVDLVAVPIDALVAVVVRRSPQVAVDLEMTFGSEATISQVRQAVAAEFNMPLHRVVLVAAGWGILAKLSLAIADYLSDDPRETTKPTLTLSLGQSGDVVEVVTESNGACLVDLARYSSSEAVMQRAAEFLDCDADGQIMCTLSGAVVRPGTTVSPLSGPFAMLPEDAVCRAMICGQEFAFPAASPTTVESHMPDIEADILLVYHGAIVPEPTHRIVAGSTYARLFVPPGDLGSVTISKKHGHHKTMLTLRVIRPKAAILHVMNYVAAQLGKATPSPLLGDDGSAFPQETLFSSLPATVRFFVSSTSR